MLLVVAMRQLRRQARSCRLQGSARVGNVLTDDSLRARSRKRWNSCLQKCVEIVVIEARGEFAAHQPFAVRAWRGMGYARGKFVELLRDRALDLNDDKSAERQGASHVEADAAQGQILDPGALKLMVLNKDDPAGHGRRTLIADRGSMVGPRIFRGFPRLQGNNRL